MRTLILLSCFLASYSAFGFAEFSEDVLDLNANSNNVDNKLFQDDDDNLIVVETISFKNLEKICAKIGDIIFYVKQDDLTISCQSYFPSKHHQIEKRDAETEGSGAGDPITTEDIPESTTPVSNIDNVTLESATKCDPNTTDAEDCNNKDKTEPNVLNPEIPDEWQEKTNVDSKEKSGILQGNDEEPKSGEAATKEAGGKDTKILIFLFVAVASVGVAAFAYNFIKKRKNAQNAANTIENGVASVPARRNNTNTRPEIREEEMKEMKPLMDTTKIVDESKQEPENTNNTDK